MKKEYCDRIIKYLEENNYKITERKEIPYGMQFRVNSNGVKNSIRIFENKKKKLTLDLSQVKDNELKIKCAEYDCGISENSNKNTDIMVSPPLIGSDEAGKGDYFGPLTVCAVYADEKMFSELRAAGIKDSKKLTDKKIDEFKDIIIEICPYYCVVEVKNRQFNDMHAKVNNINEILAHAHAACIKNLYQKTKCENVLIDKFANEYRMENELRELPLHITQRPKAEQNIAVAAASILARYTYMTRLKSMSEEYGIDFCAGAGTQADICANKFAEIYGKDKLYDICKISYKNTQRVK